MGIRRILVVEDEPLVRLDIEDALRSAGYEVAGSAISGEEAIAKSRRLRPDIVLMDMNLRGDMEGSTAAHFIQKEKPVPVIFVSAHLELEEADETPAPIFRVKKPFTRQDLMRAVTAASVKCADELPPPRL